MCISIVSCFEDISFSLEYNPHLMTDASLGTNVELDFDLPEAVRKMIFFQLDRAKSED
jgi:hypothetical protein